MKSILFIIALLAAFACSKKSDPTPSESIVVIGEIIGKPTYWVNGVYTQFTSSVSTVASCGYYDGTSYYAGGTYVNAGKPSPAIWKFGASQLLTDGLVGDVSSISSVGTDIYASGRVFSANDYVPVYWKNGAITYLPTTGSASARSIFVMGNDVYVAGTDNGSVAYWKNGSVVKVAANGYAVSIKVVGSDVYLAGKNALTWGYWKNGVFSQVETPNNVSLEISDLSVNGADVYVAGTQYLSVAPATPTATYWKNGTMFSMASGTLGKSIFIKDNDVYMAGSTSNFRPIYWKNGKQNLLLDTSGSAFFIYVR